MLEAISASRPSSPTASTPYVEYTGTALTAILKQPLPSEGTRDPASVDRTITRLYDQRYHVRVFPSLGFNDTFAMVIRGVDARQLHLKTISDILPYAPTWRLGVGYEFAERPDGLRGLSAAYNLHFEGDPRTMELGLLYRSLAAHQVDIVAGNSTDGAIRAFDLRGTRRRPPLLPTLRSRPSGPRRLPPALAPDCRRDAASRR